MAEDLSHRARLENTPPKWRDQIQSMDQWFSGQIDISLVILVSVLMSECQRQTNNKHVYNISLECWIHALSQYYQ